MSAIAADLAFALDPVRFAAKAGLVPDPWQAAVLRSTASRILLNCSRQSGKSSITATLAMHEAIYVPGSLILVLSRAERQSKELFRKCTDTFRALGRPVAPEVENKMELELTNRSRIVALPGAEATVRSFSGVTLILVDEASRVPDALYYSVRPMLAVSGGRLIGLSSPFGRRGWWHDAWENGGPSWERYEIPAPMCPRITPEFLAEEEASMPRWWFMQEYMCKFLEDLDAVFRYDDILAALSPDVTPLFAVNGSTS